MARRFATSYKHSQSTPTSFHTEGLIKTKVWSTVRLITKRDLGSFLAENGSQQRAFQENNPDADICSNCRNGVCDPDTGDCDCFAGFLGGNCDSKLLSF